MTAFDPEKITFFAKTDARGKEVSFGIKARDRQRHMYVVGKTGMGKSTLLENMAAQDIQNGEGMAFIDPHGSAAETLLQYVPEHRVKDVVYFAPFDLDNPVSFNVMEDVGPDKRHLVVSGLMSTFKKIWVDAWSARMEYILTNALLVLIEYPDTTLLSVNRLFIDKKFRERVVDYCKDPAVKSFWQEEFAGYTDRFAAEALPAIQNKIGQFTGNPLIRNIIGQPHSSFDIREIMDDKKILIMNLSKGLIGETNANLLGSMLTTRIYLAAMSRADLPVEKMKQMPNFYFYVDEFQSFANATFANILSEARKYHLNLIIAHQYIEQMEEEVRDAVFGNVGTTVSFRVGPFDAETLETVFTPRFLAADLVNLGFAQIYLTLMIDGVGSQPFSATTLPPIQYPSVSCKGMVIESSRKLYAKERASVEKIVADLHTPEKKEDNKKSFDNNKSAGGNNYSSNSNSSSNKNQPSKPWPAKKPESVAEVAVASVPPPQQQTQTQSQPRAENTNFQKPNSNNSANPRFQKTVPNQKTPEDLRNILSKMTKPSVPEDKSNSVSVAVKEEKSEVKKEAPKTEPASDLKSALASVLSSMPTQVASNKTVAKPEVSVPAQVKSEVPPRVEAKPEFSKPTEVKKEENPAPASRFVRKESTGASRTGIRRVVVEERRFHKMNFADELEQAEESNNSNQLPAISKSSQPPLLQQNNLNPAEIKKMLRHNDQERSPFI